MKTLFTFFALLLLSFVNYAAVIDPSNLAQNISQVIQSKLMSKIQGDTKEIANSQLKTENQTTADIIGMNSTEKTRLNLEMADFNYSNNPSDLIKNYYAKDMNIRGRNYAALTHLQRVKAFFQQDIIPIINALQKEMYIIRFNHIFEGISTIDTRYQPFTNTVDNAAGASSSSETGISSYANGGQTGTGIGQRVNTKEIERTFNNATKALTNKLTGLGSLKGNLESADGPEEVKLMILERYLIQSGDGDALNTFYSTMNSGGTIDKAFNNIESVFSDKIDNLSFDFQDQMISTMSDALGVGLGGIFGGSANEKGKGQRIEIDAKLGRLTDMDRIQLINKQVDLYSKIESEISRLHTELITLKRQKENVQYSEDTKFNVSNFYKSSGAMDASKMMNFDK
ncbi:MAG: hypothetical protein RLZZ306_2757 [Bacteroidota bacterium]